MSGAMSDGSTRGSNPLYLLTLLRGGVLVAYLAHNQMDRGSSGDRIQIRC